ncbi:hypothetical protein ACFLV2_00675 [Chloroflexota bacterium]
MSKKFKVLMAGLTAALLITVVPATMALADEEETAQGPASAIVDRVAEILGISADDLTAAFDQAREEAREECEAIGDCDANQQRIANRFAERQERWQENKAGINGKFQGNNRQAGRGRQSATASTVGNTQQTMALETVVR